MNYKQTYVPWSVVLFFAALCHYLYSGETRIVAVAATALYLLNRADVAPLVHTLETLIRQPKAVNGGKPGSLKN
jgi:hypothetical protein